MVQVKKRYLGEFWTTTFEMVSPSTAVFMNPNFFLVSPDGPGNMRYSVFKCLKRTHYFVFHVNGLTKLKNCTSFMN